MGTPNEKLLRSRSRLRCRPSESLINCNCADDRIDRAWKPLAAAIWRMAVWVDPSVATCRKMPCVASCVSTVR